MPDETQSVKRWSERKRARIAVTLVLEGDKAEDLATTVDLSPLGVRLQSDATLAPGQRVGLLLATEPQCLINARVVWVGKADSAQAGQAGLEFLDPLKGPVC
jgi:hypothetical protein